MSSLGGITVSPPAGGSRGSEQSEGESVLPDIKVFVLRVQVSGAGDQEVQKQSHFRRVQVRECNREIYFDPKVQKVLYT